MNDDNQISADDEAEMDGRLWFVFSSRGMASLAIGDSVTKAIADWKKKNDAKNGEVIGVIKAGGPIPVGRMCMAGTHVFGVICCVQKQ